MRSKWNLLLVVFISVVLVGCAKTQAPASDPTASESLPLKEVESGEGEENMDGSMGLSDWVEAVLNGEKLACSYTDEQGGKANIMVDGKKYRMEYSSSEGMMTTIFDGETTYTWMEGQDTGFMMNMVCIEDMAGSFPEEDIQDPSPTYSSSEEAMMNLQDITCVSSGDVDMTIPSDVEFVDQCMLMQEQMEQLEKLRELSPEIPEGIELVP